MPIYEASRAGKLFPLVLMFQLLARTAWRRKATNSIAKGMKDGSIEDGNRRSKVIPQVSHLSVGLALQSGKL